MATDEPLDSGQRGKVITTASITGLEGTRSDRLLGGQGRHHRPGSHRGPRSRAARHPVMCIAPGTFLNNVYPDPVAAEQQFGPMVPDPERMGRPDEYATLAVEIVRTTSLNGEVIRLDGALRFDVR
jgi:hypothetical protein